MSRAKRRDRISLGRGPVRSAAGAGGRFGSPPGRRHRRDRRHRSAVAAKARDDHDPHRLHTGTDPVKLGLVASLNRPGGNVTGVNFSPPSSRQSGWSCCTSWFQRRPAHRRARESDHSPGVAQRHEKPRLRPAHGGKGVAVFNAATESEIDDGLRRMLAGAVRRVCCVGSDPFFISRRDQMWRWPHAMHSRDLRPCASIAEAGGLMSYGTESQRCLSSSRHLCRTHPQGREAGRPAGRAADQVRAGHQPQDRQGARPHHAADAARRAPTR